MIPTTLVNKHRTIALPITFKKRKRSLFSDHRLKEPKSKYRGNRSIEFIAQTTATLTNYE